MSALTHYKAPPSCLAHYYLHYCSHEHSNKWLYHMPAITTKILLICIRDMVAAVGLLLPWQKEDQSKRRRKGKAKDPPMFTVASLPRRIGAAR